MKLELNEQQLQVIAEALGNTPLRISLPVYNEINKQITEQTKESE